MNMYLRRLWDLREDNDLGEKEVADYLNIKQQNYSRYETGEVLLPIYRLIALAKYYNTSTDYILELTNVKKPYPKTNEVKTRS